MNSNTFQDQAGQAHLLQVRLAHRTPTPPRARRRSSTTSNASRSARQLGSKALTVWIGDGANFPGQSNFTAPFERYSTRMREIYAALPDDWRHVPRAQDVRAGLLFDRDRRTGAPAT